MDVDLRGGVTVAAGEDKMPHLGTGESFLLGGVLGLLFLMWLLQPHPTLDRINDFDITEEKLQRATHSKDAGSCLYLIGLLIMALIVWTVVLPLLFGYFTPEATDQIYRNFWRIK